MLQVLISVNNCCRVFGRKGFMSILVNIQEMVYFQKDYKNYWVAFGCGK